MKNKENIDDLLKGALSEEDAEILERLGDEQSIFEQLKDSYSGKMKWISIYVTFLIFVFSALFFYCLIVFLNTEDIRDMLLWGAGLGGSFLMIAMLKIWKFMQMDKNSLLREIKRLELQISLLAKK